MSTQSLTSPGQPSDPKTYYTQPSQSRLCSLSSQWGKKSSFCWHSLPQYSLRRSRLASHQERTHFWKCACSSTWYSLCATPKKPPKLLRWCHTSMKSWQITLLMIRINTPKIWSFNHTIQTAQRTIISDSNVCPHPAHCQTNFLIQSPQDFTGHHKRGRDGRGVGKRERRRGKEGKGKGGRERGDGGREGGKETERTHG